MVSGARLEARAVSKAYAGVGEQPIPTLDRVELEAGPGEFIALIGPSGAGKSTLFSVLAGLERADSGEALVGGAPVALGACAFMPQRDALLPWRRTIDNVAIGLELAGVARPASSSASAWAASRRHGRGSSRAACASAPRSCARSCSAGP